MLGIEYFSKVRLACLTHLSGSFHPYWTTLIWLTLGGDHANMGFIALGYIAKSTWLYCPLLLARLPKFNGYTMLSEIHGYIAVEL